MITLAMYSNICLAFYRFPDLSCSNDYGVPCKFAQATRSSRPLLCDYIILLAVINRSDKHMKIIEMAPPSWVTVKMVLYIVRKAGRKV